MVTKAIDNPGNFTVGPSNIYVGAYGDLKAAAREVGMTQGGVSYNHTKSFKEFDDADQYISVIGVEKIAERLEITYTMKENVLENFALAWDLPDSSVDEVNDELDFGGDPQTNYRSLFIDGPAPDGGTRSHEFWKVVAYSSSEIAQTKDDNAVLEVTMLVIEDITKVEGQRFGKIADVYDDTTLPSVSSITPADLGSDVAIDTTVAWIMSEAIQQRDITSGNFNVVDDTGAEVAGSLAYNKSTFTVTFTPTSVLSGTTTYLTFASGEVRDMAGNAMGDNSRTSFDTIV